MLATDTLNYSLTARRNPGTAANAFENAYLRGLWDRLWAKLTGRAHQLQALPDGLEGQHFTGAQVVPVDAIQGSENRTEDFDADFHPLRAESKERWTSVFTAWRQGRTLPPVDLVKVGSTYYVRDGHHRISVARTLGQDYIDAIVVEAATRAPR